MAEQASDVVFFEKQEEDSMLCAQHTLNNLLQQSIYSASELAAIAGRLDVAEADIQYSDNNLERRNRGRNRLLSSGKHSNNMDDSGFFSVQVLIEALKLFDVKLVHWKTHEMEQLGLSPEEQQAFIFHGDLHWFAMRRFASNPEYFVDLDSCLDSPKRVGATYLRMRIDQAESQGYTIFSVLPNHYNTSVPQSIPPVNFSDGTVLPRCLADDYPSPLFVPTGNTRNRDDYDNDNDGSDSSTSQPSKRVRKQGPDSESGETLQSVDSASSTGELSLEELRRRRIARFGPCNT